MTDTTATPTPPAGWIVDAARPGDLIEIHPEVIRVGRTLAFVECRVRVGDRAVARGSATFRMG
ncbi:MAG: hypothetical protein RJA99_3 [Pseudomonadota bacterium]|jgi:acyl-coenzyme A thioesterase PaaI-like protein